MHVSSTADSRAAANPLAIPRTRQQTGALTDSTEGVGPPSNGTLIKGAMTVTIKRVLSLAALIALAAVPAVAQGPDPLLGTWKLNAAKSKAPFTSGTTVFDGTADTLKGTVDLVGTDGTKFHWTFAAKYDGKDHPATGSSPFGDTLAITRVDKNTIRIVSKLAGKQTIVQTIVVAPDGKTRTTTAKGTDGKGQPVDSMSFYEKQ